jgi:hypothetical protein
MNNHYPANGSQCSQILTEKTASTITEQVIDDITLIPFLEMAFDGEITSSYKHRQGIPSRSHE